MNVSHLHDIREVKTILMGNLPKKYSGRIRVNFTVVR